VTHSYIIEDRFIHWMNVIRNTEDPKTKYDLLEAFWGSQIKSKGWMIEEIKNIYKNNPSLEKEGVAYVFGGWHGLAAMYIIDNLPNIKKVYSIDKDEKCADQGSMLTNYDPRIIFLTQDMTKIDEFFYHNFKTTYRDIEIQEITTLIVNTSTEHITQEDFNTWVGNIPLNTLVCLQGNNFSSLDDHIRTSENMKEFLQKNKMDKVLYSGELDCVQFTRFMEIGYNEL